MSPRKNEGGSFEASGPNLEARNARTAGAAISLAQNYATRHHEEGTWYVRLQGVVRYRVHRDERGRVFTTHV